MKAAHVRDNPMKKKINAFPKNFFEEKAWENMLFVCGIDEVGRGCLAGPVVTAAVIIPQNSSHKLLKDSKILTQKERELAFDWITQHCFYATALACHKTIDQHNIYQATRLAMKKAYISLIEQLPFALEKIKYVVVDAMPLTLENAYAHLDLEIRHFNYGESISTSIAAASIVAKVTRDRLMEKIHPFFPMYALEQHKGYCTKLHVQAVLQHGPSLLHRASFLGKLQGKMSSDNEDLQQSLFE